MSCKFIQGDGFNAFQCTPNEGLYFGNFEGAIRPNNKPYDELECRHTHRTEMKGVLTCLDCCYIYNEKTLDWEEPCY